MITDIKKDDFGIEGKVYLDYFDADCNVVIDIDANLEYAEKCVEMLDNLSDEALEMIEKALKVYCLTKIRKHKSIRENITFDVDNVKNMLDYIFPQTVYIDNPEDDDEPDTGVRLECECDWEFDGIMEIIIRQGEVLYVGKGGELGVFDDFEYFNEDENNYINKI